MLNDPAIYAIHGDPLYDEAVYSVRNRLEMGRVVSGGIFFS